MQNVVNASCIDLDYLDGIMVCLCYVQLFTNISVIGAQKQEPETQVTK